MQTKSWMRDVVLLLVACAAGWWAHSTHPVHAESEASGPMAFQVLAGADHVPNLYVGSGHRIYVYPLGTSNNQINCSFSLRVDKPGGQVERENCGLGPNH